MRTISGGVAATKPTTNINNNNPLPHADGTASVFGLLLRAPPPIDLTSIWVRALLGQEAIVFLIDF